MFVLVLMGMLMNKRRMIAIFRQHLMCSLLFFMFCNIAILVNNPTGEVQF